MNRANTNLLRGLSSDERMKTKTKKSKMGQERREINALKTNEGLEGGRNIDVLLNIANSMKLLADRHSEQRFKAIDVKVLELIVSELTLMRRMEEYEREQNRAKVREMRSLIEKVVAKKNDVLAESERINLLIRSGSPKNRKGIIAYEMSPPMLNNHIGGLIERKIEEDNRERVTFEAMKKKDERLTRLFEFIDRMAQKLNVGNEENGSLKWKISKIAESVQSLASSEEEYKNRLKEQNQYNSKLKQEIETLSNHNDELKTHVNALRSQLEQCKEQANVKNRLYSQLQQDFNLLAKEKLDAQTTFSKILSQSERLKDKYQRRINNLKVRFSQILKEEVQQLKNAQVILGKQVEEFTLMHCESVNTIIYHYTKEMMVLSFKRSQLKKQVLELQKERNMEQEDSSKELQRLRNEIQEIISKENIKRQGLGLFKCFYEKFQGQKMVNNDRFAIDSIDIFTIFPTIKSDQGSQTQTKTKIMNFSTVMNTIIKPRQSSMGLISNILAYTLKVEDKESFTFQTQTDQEIIPLNEAILIQTQDESSQTANDQYSQGIQAIPQAKDASTYTQTPNLAIFLTLQLSSQPHPKENKSTETQLPSMLLQPAFSQTIFPTTKQTTSAETNTETVSHHQPLEVVPPPSTRKPTMNSDDPFLSFLLQAQQCTIVPQISLLREQLQMQRIEIASLRSQLSSMQAKESEQATVFQFCY